MTTRTISTAKVYHHRNRNQFSAKVALDQISCTQMYKECSHNRVIAMMNVCAFDECAQEFLMTKNMLIHELSVHGDLAAVEHMKHSPGCTAAAMC